MHVHSGDNEICAYLDRYLSGMEFQFPAVYRLAVHLPRAAARAHGVL
jgi:hypothetical protein